MVPEAKISCFQGLIEVKNIGPGKKIAAGFWRFSINEEKRMGTIVAAAFAGAATDRPVQRMGGEQIAAGMLNQRVIKHIFMGGMARW